MGFLHVCRRQYVGRRRRRRRFTVHTTTAAEEQVTPLSCPTSKFPLVVTLLLLLDQYYVQPSQWWCPVKSNVLSFRPFHGSAHHTARLTTTARFARTTTRHSLSPSPLLLLHGNRSTWQQERYHQLPEARRFARRRRLVDRLLVVVLLLLFRTSMCSQRGLAPVFVSGWTAPSPSHRQGHPQRQRPSKKRGAPSNAWFTVSLVAPPLSPVSPPQKDSLWLLRTPRPLLDDDYATPCLSITYTNNPWTVQAWMDRHVVLPLEQPPEPLVLGFDSEVSATDCFMSCVVSVCNRGVPVCCVCFSRVCDNEGIL